MSYSLRMHNGYRVMILGRFNRRVRITYYWIIRGKVSLTSRYSYVDYSKQVVTLKNGVCSIKFWLSFNQ
jgi:ribosomal protein S3